MNVALLVVDCQPVVLAALPDADGLVSRLEAAIAEVRAVGGTIVHVRVGFTEDDWRAVPASHPSFGPVARHRLLREGDPATALRLTPQDGDIVVRKTRHGAMSTTDLDERLRARGITTLVVAGVSTSGAVLSTVLEAADRDYRVYVLAECVADPDAEAHEVVLGRVLPSRAEVMDTAGLREVLAGARS